MKTLYLECLSGISGDMTVAALLDLGANQKELASVIDLMNLGCELYIGKSEKNGISSCFFDVKTIKKDECCRGINDIYEIINKSTLTDNAKNIAKKIFDVVADAEAIVHKKSREEVHFHEVGALDSIVDICAVAFCLDNLKISRVICSPISDGFGFVNCAHGKIPIPVPAVVEIAKAKKIPIKITENNSEMITPTGAAIVGAIADKFENPKNIVIQKTGIGAGKKEFSHPNILRAFIFEDVQEDKDNIIFIQTAIDDSTPEQLAFCLEKLFEIGVSDAFYSPVYMKKNRPAWQLSVMCNPNIESEVIGVIFKQTTAVGVRRQSLERVIMKRESTKIDTKYGKVDANIFYWNDIEKTCIEYESAKEIAQKNNCSILDIYKNY